MNTNILKICSFIFSIVFYARSEAQNNYELGVLPSLNINKKFKNDWSLNARIESRQLFSTGTYRQSAIRKYDYVLTDFAWVAARNIGLNSRLAGGYLLRVEDGDVYHRLMQQFVVVQKFSYFRLAHRFLTDQTFSRIEKPEFRIRYRVSGEIPLNGQSVDSKEFYFKINNEYVNSFQNGDYDLEIRFVPLLGYDFSDSFRIETGLDYRIDSFLREGSEQNFWLVLNFFIDF